MPPSTTNTGPSFARHRESRFLPAAARVRAGLGLLAAPGWCWLLAALPALSQEEPAPPAPPDPFVQRLRGFGLEPTTDALRSYLQSLTPSPAQGARWSRLLADLGADNYFAREAAMQDLLRQSAAVRPQLIAAHEHADYEIRWRARLLSARIERDSQDVLYTALTVIARNKLAGLCDELLARTGECTNDSLLPALSAAIESSATPRDAQFLRAALSAPDAARRRLAALGLVAALGPAAGNDLTPLLTDAEPAVQAAAARGLVQLGRREGLATLVGLLEAEDLKLRTLAYRTLKAATGENIPFVVYDSAEKRSAGVAAWKKWLAGPGAEAPLRAPLAAVTIDLGRVLICDPSGGRLVEFDLDGKQLWEQSVTQQPWACLGLPDGGRLVGLFNERSLVEYDAAGKEVWRHGGLPGGPTSIQRLEDGATLVACTEGQEVLEVSRDGKIVWRAKLNGRPVDARRLPDGNTLVALQNSGKVVELDRDGKTIWELGGLTNVFCAERLETGHTLVACIGHTQIREYDRSGKQVWAQGRFVNPYTCQRLPSGLTLVADQQGVYEMDPQGAIVRKWPVARVSRAHRF